MSPKEIGFYPRVSLGFTALSDAKFSLFVHNVITLTTNNPSYPTPLPTLVALTASANTFDESVELALGRGRIPIAQRNENRSQLENLLRQLAGYVTGTCQNDVLTLLTSGFEAVKVPSPVGVLDAPINLRLEYTGMSGQMLLKFKGDRNARNYSVECSLSTEGPWEDKGLSTTTRVMLDSLSPGKTYWARTCANGSAGPSEWSVPTVMMAV